MAIYNGIISLPWSLKIFFGLISDNVKLCGRKRKPYLIFFGLIQTVTMFILFQVEFSSPMAVTMLLFTASFSMAFCAVVVDAILVV
jgi:Na+/melibiose symporter-like transporter